MNAVAAPTRLEKVLIWYARRFPIRRGKARVVDALWRTAAGSSGTRRVARLAFGGFEMPCDISRMLQRQYYFFGTYHFESVLLARWHAMANGARVIFDIGANLGIYSFAALAAAPRATVHAFEPTPELAVRLREAAACNNLAGLYVHECAVMDRPGGVGLRRYAGETGANEGMNFVCADAAAGADRIEAVSLDVFCEAHGIDSVDLVKLDVQGHEPSVLRGATGLLARGALGTLFIELNWAAGETRAGPAAEVIGILSSAGYRFAAPSGRDEWRPAGDWLRDLYDVIARRL